MNFIIINNNSKANKSYRKQIKQIIIFSPAVSEFYNLSQSIKASILNSFVVGSMEMGSMVLRLLLHAEFDCPKLLLGILSIVVFIVQNLARCSLVHIQSPTSIFCTMESILQSRNDLPNSHSPNLRLPTISLSTTLLRTNT